MIVLDTDVLAELLKPVPSSPVIAWLWKRPALLLFTTPVTQAEILYGVELLPKSKRKSALDAAVTAIFEQDCAARVLCCDIEAARAFPKIAAARRAAGFPIAESDA